MKTIIIIPFFSTYNKAKAKIRFLFYLSDASFEIQTRLPKARLYLKELEEEEKL